MEISSIFSNFHGNCHIKTKNTKSYLLHGRGMGFEGFCGMGYLISLSNTSTSFFLIAFL